MVSRNSPVAADIASRCRDFADRLSARPDDHGPERYAYLMVARDLADAGLLGLTIPPGRGGQGMGLFAAVLALEAVGRICPEAVDPLFFANFSAARLLGETATQDLRDRVLRPLLAGEATLPLAVTEQDAGTAAADLAATAHRSPDGYVVTGAKRFIVHVDHAPRIAVAARFGSAIETIGVVVVDATAPGLTFGPSHRFMGGEGWRDLRLDSVAVPARDVVLAGGLFTRWGHLFDCDKLGTAARALGLAAHAFEAARAYAAARRQFGRLLCEFQAIQMKFAEMDARITAARQLLTSAAEEADHGEAIGREAAMAKLLCVEAAQMVCGEAAQIMGAVGASDLARVEYCLRKSHDLTITSGTSTMLKLKLAESVFGRRFSQTG